MVRLTRLNNQPIVVNSDLVKFVEQAPDTLITLVNGEKFMVRESCEEVIARIIEFRRTVLQGVFPAWDRIATPAPQADEQEPEGKE
jgi:flagellar protein FlbD